MKIVKPFYINYQIPQKDQILTEICSIDIHPSGKKFATSGGGDKYGIITIWNMDPIRYKEKEMDEKCPKILYTDYTHLKCVNCVRWSPNGKYLASGSVDAVVVIWVQRKLSDLENKDKKFHESYRSAFQLRGHSYDVVDLAWSPHGTYLASGSVDNRIIIWNVEKFPEKTAVLTGHDSYIKGVCWDPVGRYLASQSEDYTLRIWRTSDWKQEIKLCDEIDKNSTCSFRRLTWSPDGSNIVATGTSNSGAPTSQLYNRDNWSKGVDLVGHKQHRYFPTLLRCKETNKEFLLLALGSKDRSLSVWTTLRRRPLVVISDLFTYSIVDLSWYIEKFELIACSLDGSIAYVQFTTEELGTPLTSDEMMKYFEKTYGTGFVSDTIAMSKSKADAFILPESSAVLELQRKQQQLIHDKKSSCLHMLNSEKKTGPNEQITCHTKNGKRRITPKFLNSLDEEDIEPDPVPIKRICSPETSENNDASKPKEDDDVMISNTLKVSSKIKSVLEEKFVKPESPNIPPINNNIDDKRDSNNFKAKTSRTSENNQTSKSIVNIDSRSPKKDDKNSDNLSSKPTAVDIKSPKKDEKTPDLSSTSSPIVVNFKSKPFKDQEILSIGLDTKPNINSRRSILMKDVVDKLNSDFIKPLDFSTSSLNMSLADESPKKNQREPKPVLEKKLHLNQTVIKANFSLLCMLPGESDHFVVKIVNENGNGKPVSGSGNSVNETKLCKVVVNLNDQKSWEVSQTKSISVIAHYKEKLFFGDVCGFLHAFNLKGGRTLAPLILDGGLTNLTCDGKYLIAVTVKATLYAWTLTPFIIFIKESFVHLLTDDGDKTSVKNVSLSTEGNISLTFETGSSFFFNKQLASWHEVFNNSTKSEFWSIFKFSNKNLSNRPLGLMQMTDHLVEDCRKGLSTDARMELILDRLEIQVKLAESLNSQEEYKYWLLLWIRHLIEADKENRVRDICQNFLGPINISTKSSWEPFILRYSKHELLKEILPLFALNLRMQRLYIELKEQLEMLD